MKDSISEMTEEIHQLKAEIRDLKNDIGVLVKINNTLGETAIKQGNDTLLLKAENVELKKQFEKRKSTTAGWRAYDALKIENEALKKDAERFRWLRACGFVYIEDVR